MRCFRLPALVLWGLAVALPLAGQEKPTPKPKTHAEIHAEAHARALEALHSPRERYEGLVEGAIGEKWQSYRQMQRETVPGWLEVIFYVTPKGKVEGMSLQDATASNTALTELCLRAVCDAQIPPMPPEVAAELPEKPGLPAGRLRFDIKFEIKGPPHDEKKEREKAAPATSSSPKMDAEGQTWQHWLARQKELKPYYSQVGGLLQEAWQRHLAAHRAKIPEGQLRLSFLLKPGGEVDEVLILDKEAPTRLKDAGLAVLHSVKFPPLPVEADTKPGRGIRVPCTFSTRGPGEGTGGGVETPGAGGK